MNDRNETLFLCLYDDGDLNNDLVTVGLGRRVVKANSSMLPRSVPPLGKVIMGPVMIMLILRMTILMSNLMTFPMVISMTVLMTILVTIPMILKTILMMILVT